MVGKSMFGGLCTLLVCLGCGGAASDPKQPLELQVPEPVKEKEIELAGGDFARLGRMTLRLGEFMNVPSAPCQEAFLFVEQGEVEVTDKDGTKSTLTVDDGVSFADAMFQVASNTTSIVAFALVRPLDHPFGDPFVPPIDEEVCGEPRGLLRSSLGETLQAAGGKLGVNILFEESSGAKHGAFSILSATSPMAIPDHRHASSVEALYIVDGKGKMLVGTDLVPVTGHEVMYVPQNEVHGFQNTGTTLRAYQVYAPFGPEQRFRTP